MADNTRNYGMATDHENSPRLISVGMPIYNGGNDLKQALDNILAQTAQNFEVIISDNSSTDLITQQITEEYARRDPRIRLTRQPANLGALPNFQWVVRQARGDYFLWVAHDDFRSANYIEALSRRLDEVPDAILATGITENETTTETGEKRNSITLMAPNADRWTTLDVFSKEAAYVWIYGMYRTEWLKQSISELDGYPLHYWDLIFIFRLLLTERSVGAPNATFYYHHLLGKYPERTYRRKINLWAIVGYHLTRYCFLQLPANERMKGLGKAWWLIYLHCMNRRNPIGTSVRITKVAAFWTWFGIETATQQIIARVGSLFQPSHRQVANTIEATENGQTKNKQRRAA